MLNFVLHSPTRIHFGQGVVNQTGDIVRQHAKKVLLVTGRSSTKKTGTLQKVMASLEKSGVEMVLFDRVEPNPRATTIDEAGELARKEQCELIIGLGGGSAMDAAKAIATVAISGRPIHEYIRGNQTRLWKTLLPIQQALPIITIPTLAATGSEANSGAVITNWETKEKSSISGPGLFPKEAILDPELTYSVPTNYTSDGAVDIFTHLYEAYMTGDEQANVQDEITEGLIRNVVRYAKQAIDTPDDYEARSHLLWSSTLALIGIPNAGRGGSFPVHQMEHTLSAYYDISHGRGLAILTPAYFRRVVKEDRPHRLARLGRAVFQVSAPNDVEAAEATIQEVIKWFKELNVYDTLEAVGVAKSDLQMMAEETIRISGGDQNYIAGTRSLYAKDILSIFEEVYHTQV
ncbi:iron-containing alcohol dehydrogenase [Ammoniphilus sp. CFH 90114]|uniref:iron-containing alcohol dehydrogenase n=1 Tax=Ammoniphilus sp. CFH 90114 TaxID=2493665 RepID=UPI00100EC84B|nr:iron-containing alcohol dehydrogenase [Ammoniphilus sp. CFH 90114]RXT07971.1 iron-containing alcohol dehydrogenase [Ammoniphilus sp. CFH 90114]